MEINGVMRNPPPYNWRRLSGDQPFRWRKSQGEPTCLFEWIAQRSWLPAYIAVVVTIMLLLQVRGL